MKNYLLYIGVFLFVAVAAQAQEKNEEMRPSRSQMKQPITSSSAITEKKASTTQQHIGQRSVKPTSPINPAASSGADSPGLGKNRKTPKATGLQTRPAANNQLNSSNVILSKASLSNWKQIRTKSVSLTSQIKVLPKDRKVISNVTRTLDEIDKLMQRVAELQINPQRNKLALMSASVDLQKFEKKIKRLQAEIKLLNMPEKKPAKDGDDAQLASIELENMLQKQEQTIQMLSNVSKVLHDTALAVIRKIS